MTEVVVVLTDPETVVVGGSSPIVINVEVGAPTPVLVDQQITAIVEVNHGIPGPRGLAGDGGPAAAAFAAAAAESALRAEQYAVLTEQIRAAAEGEAAERTAQYEAMLAGVVDPITGFIHDDLLPPIIDCGTPTAS